MESIDQTRNKNLKPDFFNEKTLEFFNLFNGHIFDTAELAGSFIETTDAIAESIIESMKENNTTYSDETILILGSALGEALRLFFDGEWKFSEIQNRWVVFCKSKKGEMVQLNSFRKIEKRLANGIEDSISYYFDITKKQLSE